MKTATNGVMPT